MIKINIKKNTNTFLHYIESKILTDLLSLIIDYKIYVYIIILTCWMSLFKSPKYINLQIYLIKQYYLSN